MQVKPVWDNLRFSSCTGIYRMLSAMRKVTFFQSNECMQMILIRFYPRHIFSMSSAGPKALGCKTEILKKRYLFSDPVTSSSLDDARRGLERYLVVICSKSVHA